jgi:hypothetical protein
MQNTLGSHVVLITTCLRDLKRNWKEKLYVLLIIISYIIYYNYTVIRESFLNRQMALYILSLIWRKGYYGAYRTPGILRLFLIFFRR